MKIAVIVLIMVVACVLSAQANIRKDPPAPGFSDSNGGPVPHVTFTADGYSPKWSRLDRTNGDDGNLRWITITGCGFRTYAEAVCVWDFKFTSTYSFIADDNTIICELPELPRDYFKTLPQNSRLDVIFDGDQQERLFFVGAFRWGPQIDCTTPIAPTDGPAVSSGQITVFGEGFQDARLENAQIFFDDVGVSATAVSDTELVASVPNSNEIHHLALVSVSWQVSTNWKERGSIECYLHSHVYYEYGPIITSAEGCGLVHNNDVGRVTIHGRNFADGLFAPGTLAPDSGASRRQTIMLEVTIADPKVDYDEAPNFGARTVYQITDNIVVSDTSISFLPPDPFVGSTDEPGTTLVWLKDATVDIYYRQTKRWVNIGAATFKYGPYLSTITDDWHHGGGDTITITGCGFNEVAFTEDRLSVESAGQSVCENDLNIVNDNTMTCTAAHVHSLCTDDDQSASTVQVEWTLNGVGETFWVTSDLTLLFPSGNDVTIGPNFNTPLPQPSRGPVKDSRVTLRGENFLFRAGATSCQNNQACTGDADDWAQVRMIGSGAASAANLIGSRELFDFTGINDAGSSSLIGFVLRDLTDSTIVVDVGTAVFGDTITLAVDFDDVDGVACEYTNVGQHTFGPTCTGTAAGGIGSQFSSGPLAGSDTTTVLLNTYGHSYSAAKARICQKADTRNQAGNLWNGGAFFGATRSPCDGDLNGADTADDDGTFEYYPSVSISGESSGVTTYSFTTGAYATARDLFRGRRVWGSLYDVVLWLPSVQSSIVDQSAPANMDDAFTTCEDFSYQNENVARTLGGSSPTTVTSCTTATSLQCGTYRFGPVATTIEPCAGPIGPPGPAITPVTVGGSDFADSWSGLSADVDGPLVSFGTLIGEGATASSSSMSVSTVWGEPSHQDATVTVFFNTCNMTMVPDTRVHWGPKFDASPMTWTNSDHSAISSTLKDNTDDIYGMYPDNAMDGGVEHITITGTGFREFCTSNRLGTCTTLAARCIIDGVHTAATVEGTMDGDSNIAIDCAMPERPFGTRASVCIEFGRDPSNMHTDPWINGLVEIDWTRTLCVEDQAIWYTPLIVDITPRDGHTSGLDGASADPTLTIKGEGFANWDANGVLDVRVGQYSSGTVVLVDDNEITAVVPQYRGEFNTDVSVHVYFVSTPRNECDDGPHDDTKHWKAWSPVTYHYGPVCTGVTNSGTTLRGILQSTSNRQNTTLIGRHFQDCPDARMTNCAGEDEDCHVPQHSDTRQYPYNPTNGMGHRLCLHRHVRAYMTFTSVTGAVGSPIQVGREQDTYDSPNSDTLIGITLRTPASINCGYATYVLDFYDALVTDEAQREVSCGAAVKVTYGPTYAPLTALFTRIDHGVFYAYGWSETNEAGDSIDDHLVTVNGLLFDDDYFSLSGNTWQIALTVGSAATLETGPSPTEATFSVPSNGWQREASIEVSWNQQTGGSGRICVATLGMFHYGPIILASNYAANECVPLDDDNEQLVVSGFAFQCCGYTANRYSNDPHRCWLDTTNVDQGDFEADTVSLASNEITCTIPESSDPAVWLVDFGLVFGVDDSTDFCSVSVCTVPDTENLGGSQENQPRNTVGHTDFALPELNVCYGPKLSAITFRVRYSGYKPAAEADTPSTNAEVFQWPVGGHRGAVVGAVCIYNTNEESRNSDNPTSIPGDGTVDCRSRLFHAQCDDPNDSLTVRFNVSADGSNFLYTPGPIAIQTSGGGAPRFRTESGTVSATVVYGPFIAEDVTVAHDFTGGSDLWDGTLDSGDLLVFWTQDNDEHSFGVETQVSLAKDWDGDHDDNPTDWGYEKAICLFGRDETPRMRRMSNYGTSQFRKITFADLTDSGSGVYDVLCPVPDGNFGEGGKIWVLLDPHADDYTRLHAPGDTDSLSRGLNRYWHWTPYADRLGKSWSGPDGLEPVTVYGGGFAPYDRVFCQYVGGSTEDAVQGDIITNTMVVCQSPPNNAPQSTEIELHFDSTTCDGFGWCAEDDVASTGPYVFTGVTDAWPRHGPIHGQTSVYFEHIGLDQYDRLVCVWHVDGGSTEVALEPSAPVQKNETIEPPANSYECVSPTASEAQLVQVEIIGYYNTFLSDPESPSSYLYSDDLGCVWFDYGLPTIDEIAPTFAEWERSEMITVTGSYFNGGSPNATGTYECWWQVGANPASDEPRDLGTVAAYDASRRVASVADKVEFVQARTGRSFNSHRLLCAAPSSSLAIIGAYPFEVIFDGLRTTDQFHFDVTQREDRALFSYDAEDTVDDDEDTRPAVTEIGGVPITITGENLGGGRAASGEHISGYLCSFDSSSFNTDPVLYSVGTYSSDGTVVCIASPRNITEALDEDDEEPATVLVRVSLDSGYSWTAPLDVLYIRDARIECLDDDGASSALFASAARIFATLVIVALVVFSV
jgi:hypothetical protein